MAHITETKKEGQKASLRAVKQVKIPRQRSQPPGLISQCYTLDNFFNPSGTLTCEKWRLQSSPRTADELQLTKQCRHAAWRYHPVYHRSAHRSGNAGLPLFISDHMIFPKQILRNTLSSGEKSKISSEWSQTLDSCEDLDSLYLFLSSVLGCQSRRETFKLLEYLRAHVAFVCFKNSSKILFENGWDCNSSLMCRRIVRNAKVS